MLKMDNARVEIGDQVYDMAFGNGVVVEIQEGEKRMVVQFGGGQRFSYTSAGLGNFPLRMLYWRNPILAPPPKDEESWQLYRKLAQAVGKIVIGV